MLVETRRSRLLDLISRQGFATLDELMKTLQVSESTVRRDLEALDLAGTVKRTHGGAVYSGEVRAMLENDFAGATLITASDLAARGWWFQLCSRIARLLAPVQ